MVQFREEILSNGLHVIVNEDRSTPLVAVNILYKVGSRDEHPDRTGFAHLFEHLMFAGSANVADFDEHIQNAGGENNAYTSNDYTTFYQILPAQNIETALWLESDRMLALKISSKSLNVQRKVVIEEFKETCLDEPYGNFWHHASALAYEKHPYRWPVIGLEPDHIEQASLAEVKDFYKKWYTPSNAILSISGNISPAKALKLAKKWFGGIPDSMTSPREWTPEPPQINFKQKTVEGPVPMPAIYLCFHTAGRVDPAFYASDLLSDILAAGPSSRLFRHLLKEKKLFSSIDAYVTANFDPGLFIIEGKPSAGVSLEEAENAIWAELDELCTTLIPERELQKVKQRYESNQVFSEMNILNKVQNLAYYAALGNTALINTEIEQYRSLTDFNIKKASESLFIRNKSISLSFVS